MKHTYLLAAFILTLLIVSGSPELAAAKTVAGTIGEKEEIVAGSSEATDGASMISDDLLSSDYPLPYPGILPDHPLYFLKRIRDAIMDKLIMDPARKAQFYTLQANKHLNMAIFLADKGNDSLASETARTATGFMEKGVGQLAGLKSASKPVPEYVREDMEKASVKHIAELTNLAEKTQGDVQAELLAAGEVMKGLREQIVGLK